ncbi:MAG: hypothetical protein QOE11_3504, partial [Solirubrobacteraceae bacterium]|nr:hypothetical protein [Solirubrobacteraceae bacterium]
GGESDLLAASSAPAHPDAYAVFHRKIGANIYSVVHRDSHGHAHRFDIPVTSQTFPQAVRLVALEGGAGMALWDEGRTQRVLARQWAGDGRLGAVQVVLSQVDTVRSGDFDAPQWRVRSDGRGTVVVASTGASPDRAASVFAALRDPVGGFGPQQELTPPATRGIDDRPVSVSPIAADGSVAVSWGPDSGNGLGGRAIRAGRAARFGPAVAQPFAGEPGLTAQNQSILADDGTPITISPALARLCPCTRPQVFRWGDGTRVLVFQILGTEFATEAGDWYVARAGAGAIFDAAVDATQNASSLPVRRARPGEIGFARFDTNTDQGLFRQHSRLIVVPFGPRVPRSRRPARLSFGTFARAAAGHLLVPVFCDRFCRVRSGTLSRVTDFRGRLHPGRLEPFSVVYMRVALPARRGSTRVRLSVTDDAGHRTVAGATFVRRRAGQWCLGRASAC